WRCCLSPWSRLKAAPTIAAVLVGQHAGQPSLLVVVEPGIDGVGVAAAEQSGVGDSIGGVSVGDLEQGGTTLPDVGLGVVVTVVGSSARSSSASARVRRWYIGMLLSGSDIPILTDLPNLVVIIHKAISAGPNCCGGYASALETRYKYGSN